MFKYSRIPRSREVTIPGTYGRYNLTLDGIVYDRLLDKIIEPTGRNYNLNLPWHPEAIAVEKLIAVCFKGWFADLRRVEECTILYSDRDRENIHPDNLIWLFPEGGLEVPTLPGYYHIPSFTSYAINSKHRVLNLFEGDVKLTSVGTNGYRDVGLRRDDGVYVGSNLHRIFALTFIRYDEDINSLVVNHKDGNRDNNNLSNLELVTYSENTKHGLAMKEGYRGSAKNHQIMRMLQSRGVNMDGIELDHEGIEVKDILNDEVSMHSSQVKAANFIGVSVGTVSLKVSGNCIYPVIMDRYIVRRVGQDWPTWNEDTEYSQAKNKTTLVRNLTTNELLEFPSAKATYTELGLSKKTVTTRLRKKDRRPIDKYVIKYKSDEDEI